MIPQPFIDNGYLQAVKTLYLGFEQLFGNSRDIDLQLLYDSIAARNSVEQFTLNISCPFPENVHFRKMACQIIKVLTKLKKMTLFTIGLTVKTQAQAEWLWHVMRVAVHTTSRQKTIDFRVKLTDNLVDWSFITRDEKLDNGTIKLLTANSKVPPGFFSHLSEIDTICVFTSKRKKRP